MDAAEVQSFDEETFRRICLKHGVDMKRVRRNIVLYEEREKSNNRSSGSSVDDEVADFFEKARHDER